MTDNNNSSAERPKKKYNNKRRNNRKNYKASGNKSNKAETDSNESNDSKKFQGNRNRRPKSLTPAKVLQKYDNLMEQYIVARKKFFELFGRTAGKQLDKVEKTYDTSLKSLREFEVKLEDWQKEVLDKKINTYAEDRDYSTNHDLKPEGDIVSFTGEFEDPHLLPTQKASEWSKDTEESEGTIEDYKKYKDSY